MHPPTWIFNPIMRLTEVFFPKRPKLRVEVRQLCEDKILASLDQDWGYSVDLYLFFHVWVVNLKEVPTAIKEWKLTLLADGKTIQAEHVSDISKWQQHTKLQEQQHGVKVIRDIHEKLDAIGDEVLQLGIPVHGWLCFLAQNTKDSLLRDATVELVLVDSFGHNHRYVSRGPWACKGNIVNPEMPF